MSVPSISLRDLLAPVTPETFFAEYHHERWLHVPGRADKFASVMSWPALSAMMQMAIWGEQSFSLVLDKRRVPAAAFCRPALDRNGHQVLQPVGDRVKELLRRGASLSLKDIETLHPGTFAVCEMLQNELGAKSAANLYCSWRGHQGFDSHYDRHDVYALQISGEKRWRIYEGRAEHPIEHPAWHNIPQAEYDRMKGAVAAELTLKPGDLLYLPRGQFHDALASSDATIHVTFSCSEPLGVDWLTGLWQAAIRDPLFREELPPPGAGREAYERRVTAFLERLGTIARAPGAIEQTMAARRDFRIPRDTYALPRLD